jgi:hypothetical protein
MKYKLFYPGNTNKWYSILYIKRTIYYCFQDYYWYEIPRKQLLQEIIICNIH